MDWLHVAEKMEENLADLRDFTAEVRKHGRRVLHIHLGEDTRRGLEMLLNLVKEAVEKQTVS